MASSLMSRCTYHAFLSFRGEDTRKNFTDHLYTALVQAGIHTFRDDDEIERGADIMAELRKAIQESKISIIVFSKDYASSRWCLDELVMIMELREAVGHIVLPVFYDVDPSQVRKQTGSFAEAFARHEKRFKEEMVERWRTALREVADLGGMVLDNKHESQFVHSIVTEIGNKLNRTVLNVASYLVGIDSHVKDINLWLQDESNDVVIAMIYGIGGIGKTTIAKTVYNMNFGIFEGRSFLGNVRETTEQPKGLVRLQKQLLSDILKGKTSKIYNADDGIIKIKEAICCRKVLLVLDDVDQLDQLDAIIGNREWLCPGSKIIITTRLKRLLTAHEDCVKFRVKELDSNQSLELFYWHAFRQHNPIEGYEKCSRSVVHHCGGLPLALEVLGSSLSGKNIDVWESAFKKLEAFPNKKIQKILEISYYSLQDDHDQNLFLDIACFFIGKDKDYTVGILDGCGFYTTDGIQNLTDRCLLTIDEDKKLMVHQLLRDMGREIIRQESIDDPGKRSRLWHHKDTFTVLKEKTGTETVKGLTLDMRRLMEDKRGKTSVANEVLETKTFTMMHKLKLLQLYYVNLRGDYKSFSKNLVWLCWHGCPLTYIPTDFYLEKLVALDMRYSSLNYVWKGSRFLAELKFLNLSHCHGLVRTPDFSALPMLERLMLKDCINLVELDESIGNLDQLILLNLKDCKNLRKLPRKVGMLKSLDELILSGCSKLDELPEELGKMKSLRVFHADGIAINQLHATTSDTKKLSLFSIITSWHSTLWSLLSPTKTAESTSFSLAFLPQSLVSLSLADCNLLDDAISCDLGSLPSLQHLNLSGNLIHSLPGSINGLTMLRSLKLRCCTELQSLPGFPMSLTELDLNVCTSLERVPNLPNLSLSFVFQVIGCDKLFEVEGLFKLEPIEKTDIAVIKSLGLPDLESLGSVEVSLYSMFLGIRRKTPLQVLHECGISSIFLPRSEVPGCFSLQITGSSISFHMPLFVGHKIRALNLCTLYAFDPESYLEYDEYGPHYAKIHNKTKRMRWTYNPFFYAPPGAEVEDMLWLSHWNFRDQLECGDEIDVSVVLPRGFQVKKCGIGFVYEPEDKGTQSITEEIVLNTYPWYQTLTLTRAGVDTYFRCHHSYVTHGLVLIDRGDELCEYEYLFERNPQVELEKCIICDDP